MEKGRGLQALREVDPLARRLEIEKKELYAQALREQMNEARRRKELDNPPRSSRGVPETPQFNCSLSCPTLVDRGKGDSCEVSPRPATGRSAVSSILTGSTSSPVQVVGSCAGNDTIEKVAQLQEMMRSRLRAVENKVNEQWVMIQSTLQDHMEMAKESAEQAAKRHTEIMRHSLDSHVETMQQRTSEEVGRKAEEACREEMRRVQLDLQSQRQEDVKELREGVARIREEVTLTENSADERRQKDLEEMRSLLEQARELQNLHDKLCRELERDQESKVQSDSSQTKVQGLDEHSVLNSSTSDCAVTQRYQQDLDGMCSSLQQLADDVQQFRKDALDAVQTANRALELSTRVASSEHGPPCAEEERVIINQVKTDLCSINLRLDLVEQSHKRQVEDLQLAKTSWHDQVRISKDETLQKVRNELKQFAEEASCQQTLQKSITDMHLERIEAFSLDLRECRQLNDLLSTTAAQLKTEHIELKEEVHGFPDLVQHLREEMSRHIGKLAVRVEMAVSATSFLRALPPSLNESVSPSAQASSFSNKISRSTPENKHGERPVRWMS